MLAVIGVAAGAVPAWRAARRSDDGHEISVVRRREISGRCRLRTSGRYAGQQQDQVLVALADRLGLGWDVSLPVDRQVGQGDVFRSQDVLEKACAVRLEGEPEVDQRQIDRRAAEAEAPVFLDVAR